MAGFISESDAAVLLAARDVLDKLEKAALSAALPSNALEVSDVLAHGRFMEACRKAEGAIFDALNVAHSYLHDGIATTALIRFRG